MYDVELFLGFPISPSFAEVLKSIDPQVLNLFLHQEQPYLQEILYQDTRYLGKYVGKISDINGLELLHANIYSILKKLIPGYPYEDTPLELFPVIHS